MSACLALAQDKDHDRDDQHHHARHHTTVRTHTYTIHHRGGTQTVTYYNYHRARTGHRRTTHTYYSQMRPYYHPHTMYTDSDWDDRIRAARRRHHHHMSWYEAVTHRNRTGHENRGLHRGWYIGRGNPHRIDTDRDNDRHHDWDKARDHHKNKDRDKDKDHDRDKGHGHYLMLANSGYQLASLQNYDYQYQHRYQHRYQRNRRQGGYHRHYTRYGYAAAGHYSNVSRWHGHGQQFSIQYVINLSSDGHARLEATSLEDRNMPNNDRNTDPHGDILRYMHSGHDVIQTGSWRQDGGSITINLDSIRYGHTNRSKSETLRGHVNANHLTIDNYDRTFYGDNFNPSFRKD